MWRMKPRTVILFGTCIVLVITATLGIYWYYDALGNIRRKAEFQGFTETVLNSGIPDSSQFTALAKWFPNANTVPRQIVETTWDLGPTYCYCLNGTRLNYDVEEWQGMLLNENQPTYSRQAFFPVIGDAILLFTVMEIVVLALGMTVNRLGYKGRIASARA